MLNICSNLEPTLMREIFSAKNVERIPHSPHSPRRTQTESGIHLGLSTHPTHARRCPQSSACDFLRSPSSRKATPVSPPSPHRSPIKLLFISFSHFYFPRPFICFGNVYIVFFFIFASAKLQLQFGCGCNITTGMHRNNEKRISQQSQTPGTFEGY